MSNKKASPIWKNAPISPTCEVCLMKGGRCGEPTSSSYPAVGGGWMALCQKHEGGFMGTTPIAELLANGETLRDAKKTDKNDGLKTLALRAYPGLKARGYCSAHDTDGHFECLQCYPDWHESFRANLQIAETLYAELLEISGLDDLPSGKIGAGAIVAEIRRKLKIVKRK